jgi:hypothetical protein
LDVDSLRIYVQTVLVYDAFMLLAYVRNVLWNLLVHKAGRSDGEKT